MSKKGTAPLQAVMMQAEKFFFRRSGSLVKKGHIFLPDVTLLMSKAHA